MIRIFNNKGELIHTSRNLRGINDHCRRMRYQVDYVSVRPKMNGGANIAIKWADGSHTATDFASYDLCVKYAQSPRFSAAAVLAIAPRITLPTKPAQ